MSVITNILPGSTNTMLPGKLDMSRYQSCDDKFLILSVNPIFYTPIDALHDSGSSEAGTQIYTRTRTNPPGKYPKMVLT